VDYTDETKHRVSGIRIELDPSSLIRVEEKGKVGCGRNYLPLTSIKQMKSMKFNLNLKMFAFRRRAAILCLSVAKENWPNPIYYAIYYNLFVDCRNMTACRMRVVWKLRRQMVRTFYPCGQRFWISDGRWGRFVDGVMDCRRFERILVTLDTDKL
jgi:hypothetical protein